MRTFALAALVLAAGCGGGGGGGGARRAVHHAEIRAFHFQPDTVTAAPGDTVMWTNHDVVPHTATLRGGWDTGQIAANASGRVVAGAAGTYAYVCAYHPNMQAVLVVR